MFIVGVPMVLVELEVVEPLLLRPENANAAPAPAAATAVQMSHFFTPEWFEYPSGELEIETEGSPVERSEFVRVEPGFEKFEIDTEGRTAGTTAATSAGADTLGAPGAWEAAIAGAGTAGIFSGTAEASSARLAGAAAAEAGVSDILSSKSMPA